MNKHPELYTFLRKKCRRTCKTRSHADYLQRRQQFRAGKYASGKLLS